jgi:hypothetical protein
VNVFMGDSYPLDVRKARMVQAKEILEECFPRRFAPIRGQAGGVRRAGFR